MDQRVIRYVKFYGFRMEQLPEAEVAHKLEAGSPAVLYQMLRQDGFPVCPICGATPEGPGHCDPPTTNRKRRARQGGGAKELPPAREAKDLFRNAQEDDAESKRLTRTCPRGNYVMNDRGFAGRWQHATEHTARAYVRIAQSSSASAATTTMAR